MLQPEPIGFVNTGVPLALLGLLAVGLPWVLVRRGTRSHWEVGLSIWASAGFLLLAEAGVFALVYGWRGVEVGAALAAAPVATAWFFLRLSGFAALLWVPVLALVWFAMAQRVEKRRGEDLTRRESMAFGDRQGPER